MDPHGLSVSSLAHDREEGCASIDWWAVLILLWAGRMVSRHGGTLVLASPQPAVARLLKSAGAARAVSVCQSVQQAMAVDAESTRRP